MVSSWTLIHPQAVKDGDHIRVGKLELVVVLKELAKSSGERSKSSSDDGLSSWLEEAEDVIDRHTDTTAVTRRFQLSDSAEVDVTDLANQPTLEAHADETSKKPKPGRLPKNNSPSTNNSKDAAKETLRRFFSGQ